MTERIVPTGALEPRHHVAPTVVHPTNKPAAPQADAAALSAVATHAPALPTDKNGVPPGQTPRVAPIDVDHVLAAQGLAPVALHPGPDGKPAADAGKTWGNPTYKRDLNFGHEQGTDGHLLTATPTGQVLWGDSHTALTSDQWANMPPFQHAEVLARLPAEHRAAFELTMAGGMGTKAHAEPPTATTHGPTTGPHPESPVPGDPSRYFICQYPSATNSQESVANNGNCGPTSLLMAAMAFGKTHPDAAHAHEGILDVRRRGGASLEERAGHNSAVSLPELERAATSFGLQARQMGDAHLDHVQQELATGHLVVALVKPGFYSHSHSAGHYVLITGMHNGKVQLNDPSRSHGPIEVARADFEQAFDAKGGRGLTISA
jgi:hypothetical protein